MNFLNLILMLIFSATEITDAVVVDPETYILHPRDRMQLVITGSQAMVQDLVVNSDGTMIITAGIQPSMMSGSISPQAEMPGDALTTTLDEAAGMPLGVVYADGKTLSEVEVEVRRIVNKYYNYVDVKLIMVRPRHFVIEVTGEVRNSVPLEVNQFTSLSVVFGMSGIIRLSPNASLRRIQIKHPDGSIDTVDYVKFLMTGDYQYNALFRGEGDLLHFPKIDSTCVVRGAISGLRSTQVHVRSDSASSITSREVVYEFLPGESLKDIFDMVGDFLPWADKGNIYLIRGGRSYPLNYEDSLFLMDFKLHSGDTIVVPETRNNILIVGGVNSPGNYIYMPMKTAFEYVNMAGGVNDRGMLNKVIVYSSNGEIRGTGLNVIVERGDMLDVPSVTLKWWQDYVTIIGAVSGVVAIYLAITK